MTSFNFSGCVFTAVTTPQETCAFSSDENLMPGRAHASLTKSTPFSCGRDCLEVTKRLAHPGERAAVLAERGDGLLASGNEDGVKHGATPALEMVVGLDPLALLLTLAGCEDGAAAKSDGEGEGLGRL